MSLRLTHTPCGEPVGLTEDNRIVEPDTDLEHHCPITEQDPLFSSQEVAT